MYIETLRHIQAYPFKFSTLYNPRIFATLPYSEHWHIFRTGSLFRTLWKVDQVYSELCHRTLFNHIQSYSEPCATLAYAEAWHTRNHGIFRTPTKLLPDAYSESCHIYENLGMCRTLTYLKLDTFRTLSKI